MATTGTGQIAAEVKPLYPIHKPKRAPKAGKPSVGVNAKGLGAPKGVKGSGGGKK